MESKRVKAVAAAAAVVAATLLVVGCPPKEPKGAKRPAAASDLAVAAASVLARAGFLQALRRLGEQFSIPFQKGASSAVQETEEPDQPISGGRNQCLKADLTGVTVGKEATSS